MAAFLFLLFFLFHNIYNTGFSISTRIITNNTYYIPKNKIIIASTVSPSYLKSVFNDPNYINKIGANTIIADDLYLSCEFGSISNIFPPDSPDLKWIRQFSKQKTDEINKFTTSNISILYQMDMFIFPKLLIQKFKQQIIDPSTQMISIDRPITIKLISAMFEEMINRFPRVSGFVIRVGENYKVSDYHSGNPAVDFKNYNFIHQQKQYILLIKLLISIICKKYSKILVFRTWDTAGFSPRDPPRFHSNPDYYYNITSKIDKNNYLYFSIKHSTTDFWRYQSWNQILRNNKNHAQIIEIQISREYEGKGSFPVYVGSGILNGFYEMESLPGGKYGLISQLSNPTLRGVWIWGEFGGLTNHPNIHSVETLLIPSFYVLMKYSYDYFHNDIISDDIEKYYFNKYCNDILNIFDTTTCEYLHKINLKSELAIMKMHYTEVYDKTLNGEYMPSGNWIRDDFIGGYEQLNTSNLWIKESVFEYLYQHELFENTILEKMDSITIWNEMVNISYKRNDQKDINHYFIGCQHGQYLSNIIYYGWKALSLGFIGEKTGKYDITSLREITNNYDIAWKKYKEFGKTSFSTLFVGEYRTGPGIDDSINKIRKIINQFKN